MVRSNIPLGHASISVLTLKYFAARRISPDHLISGVVGLPHLGAEDPNGLWLKLKVGASSTNLWSISFSRAAVLGWKVSPRTKGALFA